MESFLPYLAIVGFVGTGLIVIVCVIAIAIDSKNGPRRDGSAMSGSSEVHEFY